MVEVKLLVIAVILDFIFGDPYCLPHPIIYIGKLISFYEKLIRKSLPLKIGGFILTISTILTVTLFLTLLLVLSKFVSIVLYYIISIYFIYTSLATKCLKNEAIKIYKELIEENILNARKYLSYIVGRETTKLSKEEIIRGTVETVSENTIDGVLAPMFYLLIGFSIGYPVQSVFIYKVINTLDSMVGYNIEPFKEIGYASAKLDDIVNYLPARIGSFIMLISGWILGFDIKNGIKIYYRDRKKHKSPNSGHPEAIVAGLLKIKLGGANTYYGQVIEKPTIGDKIRKLKPIDIKYTCRIMYLSQIITTLALILILII